MENVIDGILLGVPEEDRSTVVTSNDENNDFVSPTAVIIDGHCISISEMDETALPESKHGYSDNISTLDEEKQQMVGVNKSNYGYSADDEQSENGGSNELLSVD